MTGPFDTAALRQASEMPWPKEFREQSRLWTQNSSDLAAAADYIEELEQRVAFLVAEAHGWQPRLEAAEARVKSIEAYLMEPPEKLRERAEAAEAERESWIATAKDMQAQRDEARQMCDDAVNHLRVRAEAAEADLARMHEAKNLWFEDCQKAEARVTVLEAALGAVKAWLDQEEEVGLGVPDILWDIILAAAPTKEGETLHIDGCGLPGGHAGPCEEGT